jgi:hypothetical protein
MANSKVNHGPLPWLLAVAAAACLFHYHTKNFGSIVTLSFLFDN